MIPLPCLVLCQLDIVRAHALAIQLSVDVSIGLEIVAVGLWLEHEIRADADGGGALLAAHTTLLASRRALGDLKIYLKWSKFVYIGLIFEMYPLHKVICIIYFQCILG